MTCESKGILCNLLFVYDWCIDYSMSFALVGHEKVISVTKFFIVFEVSKHMY